MLPIPKSLLPDYCDVYVPIESAYGGAVSDSPARIGHVRYQNYTKAEPLAYAADSGSQGVVFIDAVNSEGAFEIPVGSKIVINGSVEKVVTRVKECRDFTRHHWEVDVA